MEVNEFLAKLGEQTGLNGLKADEDGHCAIMVDDMAVHMQHLEEHDNLLLYCTMPMPEGADERFFRALLEINYLFRGTRGGTISTKPESDEVVLQYPIWYFHLYSMEELINELDIYMNGLDHVAAFVKSYKPAKGQDEESSGGSPQGYFQPNNDFFGGIRV